MEKALLVAVWTLRFKNKKTTGWKVIVIFSIILHVRDIELLKKIKICLGVGRIYISHTREAVVLEVQSIQSILILIQHLDKYPLITKKHADNVLFKEIINIIKKKEHLTLEGLAKIIALKGSMNRGLSDKLKLAFPHVILVERPIVTDQTIKNPYWLAGFVSAEGCFYVDIFKSQTKIVPSPPLRGGGGPAGPHRGPPAGMSNKIRF